jgi:hypothetical protein
MTLQAATGVTPDIRRRIDGIESKVAVAPAGR